MVGWAVHEMRVGEWPVSAVMSVCTGARAVVGTVCGSSRIVAVGWVCAGVQHWVNCCS